jgi:hypothetical protein
MKHRIAVVMTTLVALPVLLVALSAGPASAHELKHEGKFNFLVGFGNEPAFQGQQNFVQAFLSYAATGKPVTNVGSSLKLAVEWGSHSMNLQLVPSFDPDSGLGTVGEYDAFFFPTALGAYTFHFTGSLQGQKIDATFTGGPDTFALVTDPTTVQFPNKVPTAEQMSTRLQQEIPRLQAEVAAAQTHADSQASSAKTLGIAGIIVGALGLTVAVVALTRKRA